MENIENTVKRIFSFFGMNECGFAETVLLRSGNAPDGYKTLICTVFPYYAGEESGNISLYARGTDYHKVVRKKLSEAAAVLSECFAGRRFSVYADVSPYPEVYAASKCGLGMIGDNGLLITPKWGSYVFIGTIATDLEIKTSGEESYCRHCGACSRACPANAVNGDKSGCLSAVTQKRGELSDGEKKLIKEYDTIWGCDICQKVCPENKGITFTDILDFRNDMIYNIGYDDLNGLSDREFRRKYKDRAFSWHGLQPLKRNIEIMTDEKG